MKEKRNITLSDSEAGRRAIRLLSHETIDKIAAGEVIENPASVLKELVENSLDAGATNIVITLHQGGKELIKVADDGRGMPADEIRLSWTRHATSKLENAEGLHRVTSMGFRGEALSSMAAVADLEIETRAEGETVGTRVFVQGGEERERDTVNRNQGTTLSVKHLFRHVPVRRKFLSSAMGELRRVLKMLERLALVHPEISFRVLDEKKVLAYYSKGDWDNRIREVFGEQAAEAGMSLDWEAGGYLLQGWASPPEWVRGSRASLYFYVNNRHVTDAMLARAFVKAYDGLAEGKFPMGCLLLTLPYEEVDVNVHPAKREVRFRDQAKVFQLVVSGVRKAIRETLATPEFSTAEFSTDSHPESEGRRNSEGNSERRDEGKTPEPKIEPFRFSPSDPVRLKVREQGRPFESVGIGKESAPGDEQSAAERSAGGGEVADSQMDLLEETKGSGRVVPWPKTGKTEREAEILEPSVKSVPYLHLHGRYIAFEVQSGLLLVHQSHAHQRILYEEALDALKNQRTLNAQQLLFPEILDLGGRPASILMEHLKSLRQLGFEVEPFGGDTFQVRGIPAEISQNRVAEVLTQFGETLSEKGAEEPEILIWIAKAYARSAAIPPGVPMNYEKMENLINRLFATQNPYVSPFGKAAIYRLRREELEKKFK